MPILTAEERLGTVLGGRYRIESILGSGGTATVYRAVHTFTNREVALKILKPEQSRDRGLVARFLKEARIASTIAHPNVVAILDMGTADDCTYLAMELLRGESLAARLATCGSLPADEALTLLRPLMEAVVAAHDKGITHRDIKPDNVLVGDRGDGVVRAVLLDFGMAKTNEASAWGHMTQSGVLVGTPYYMSPEQAEGAPDIGPATDVWSTGVMLYRALAGDLPFTATSPTALLLSIARGAHVPLGERAPAVPPAIAAWVEGALVVDRARRYGDMRAMLRALDEGPTVVAPEPLPEATTRRPWRWIAIGGAAIGVAVALGLWLTAGGAEPAPELATPTTSTTTTATTAPSVVVAAEVPAEPVTEAVPAPVPEPVTEAPPAAREPAHRRTRPRPPAAAAPAAPADPPRGSGLMTEW